MSKNKDQVTLISSDENITFTDKKPPNPFINKLLMAGTVFLLVVIIGVVVAYIVFDTSMMTTLERAINIQKTHPLFDGHNDVPIQIRSKYSNEMSKVNLRQNLVPQGFQTDIPRLRSGYVGGQFWSVFVGCKSQYKDAVRQTLEQIDVVYRMAQSYSDVFQMAYSSQEVKGIFSSGKIVSFMGMEGGHHIDSSIASLRMFHRLGVRYMSINHNCHTPWSESCCDVTPISFVGLTDFGRSVVLEMNRIGMMVDLSHAHVNTMHAVLNVTKAPVIFSHSGVYSLCNVSRNVPDDVLKRVKQNGGVVMVPFVKSFIACNGGNATVKTVADHISYIINLLQSDDHVGIGADYDGVSDANLPDGLKDVSKYIYLTEELIKRGYDNYRIAKIIGGNTVRVLRAVEDISKQMSDRIPSEDLIGNATIFPRECRTDIL
jgi:membrane dipeptidase